MFAERINACGFSHRSDETCRDCVPSMHPEYSGVLFDFSFISEDIAIENPELEEWM